MGCLLSVILLSNFPNTSSILIYTPWYEGIASLLATIAPRGGEGRNWPECEGVWLPFSSLGPPDHSDHSIPACKLICTVLPLFRSWQFLFFLANLKNLPDVESRPWSSNQRVNKLQRTHLPLVWYFIAYRVSLFTMTLPNLLITFQSFLACRWNHKQTNEST